MNRQQIALGFVALCFSFAPLRAAETAQRPAKPNILIILVDDMGYSDIGCYGGEIRTPNIDRLAAGGMKFAQMHNTAKCYPTRACLQTGVYFQRTDRDFSNTATLGEVLRPAGVVEGLHGHSVDRHRSQGKGRGMNGLSADTHGPRIFE